MKHVFLAKRYSPYNINDLILIDGKLSYEKACMKFFKKTSTPPGCRGEITTYIYGGNEYENYSYLGKKNIKEIIEMCNFVDGKFEKLSNKVETL